MPEYQTHIKPKTILVIDDSQLIHMLINTILDEGKYEILHADNGKDGVKLFKSNPEINLILLDVELPDVNGFEVAKHIMQISKVPILIQTGTAGDEFINKMKHSHLKYFILKPFSKEELIKKISKILI